VARYVKDNRLSLRKPSDQIAPFYPGTGLEFRAELATTLQQ